jgi:hypothetical protein
MAGAAAGSRVVLAALALALLRRDRALAPRFAAAAPQFPDECRRFWLSWLPPLFAACPAPPLPLVQALLRAALWQFVLVLAHLRNAGAFADGAYLRDLTDALKSGPFERIFADYEALFAFLRRDGDIARLADAVRACEALAGGDTSPENVAFCDANPPVFRTASGPTDFNSLGPAKILGLVYAIFRIVLDADGDREATVRFITFRGEARVCVIAAASVYRFTITEAIVVQALAVVAARQTGSARALSYPIAYRIHKEVVMIDCQAVATFRDAITPERVAQALSGGAAEAGEAPRSCAERQTHKVDPGMLREWFVGGVDGSRSNFLFMRAAFAGALAAAAAMHEIFGSNGFAVSPFMFAADRQRVFEPGFIAQGERVWHFLPVTDEIAGMIPRFVFEGSFATTWNSVTSGMAEKVEKVRVVLEALFPRNDERCVRDIEERIQKLGVKVVDGEAKNTQFPFDLIEHMIENSNHVWKAQTNRFG